MQAALAHVQDPRYQTLELFIRMKCLALDLRSPGDDIQDVESHSGPPRSKKPPKGVFTGHELQNGEISWTVKSQASTLPVLMQ